MDATSLLAVMRRGGIRIPYIMRDEFLTDRSAGAINGTAAEPGVGDAGPQILRTVTDTENKLTISGGKLVCAGGKATPAWGDPHFSFGAAFLRANGVANVWRFTVTGYANALMGVYSGVASLSNLDHGLRVGNADNGILYYRFKDSPFSVDVGVYAVGTEYKAAIVYRSSGAFLFVRGGAYTNWTLLYIDSTGTVSTQYAVASLLRYEGSIDHIRLANLPAPFNTDYGIATQRLAGARTAGDTFTHEANCLIEWVVTTRVDGQQVVFRQQDSDNRWRVDVAADGSIALQEIVAGTPVSRGTGAAGSIANGQRMMVIADGSTICVYANNVLKITYASATNFQTATVGSVVALGTGGAISGLVAWPRTLTGRPAAILNKASA